MFGRVLFVLAALLAVTPAVADEPDPLEVLARLKPAREQWLKCAAGEARRLLATAQPAARVAETAIARCRRREQPVVRVLRAELGAPSAARVIGLLRAQDRANLVRVIERLRERR